MEKPSHALIIDKIPKTDISPKSKKKSYWQRRTSKPKRDGYFHI